MTEAEQIGRRLAQLRRKRSHDEERDIEGAEIAKAVGVSDVTYSRYESGKRTPRPEVLQALANYHGVTPAYLRYGVADGGVQKDKEHTLGDVLSEFQKPAIKRKNGGKAG